jgi:branched-chain amino acid transport system substrate-binding protein
MDDRGDRAILNRLSRRDFLQVGAKGTVLTAGMMLAGLGAMEAFIAACSSGSPASTSGGPINIAVVLSLSGAFAAFGQPAKNGIELAATHINANGGVKGQKVAFTFFDDQSTAAQAAIVAQQMTSSTSPEFVGIVGPSAFATAAPMLPLVNQAKIPLLGLFTYVNRDNPGAYIFNAFPTDADQADSMLGYAETIWNQKQIGVIYESSSYGTAIAQEIQSQAGAHGITIVDAEAYAPNSTDATPAIRRVLDKGAGGILAGVSGASAAYVLNNWKALGTSVPIIEGIAAATASVLGAAEQSARGIPIQAFLTGDAPTPVQKPFVDDYRKTYNQTPPPTAGSGYDAAQLVAIALGSGSSVNRDSLKAGLEGIKSFQGVAGSYSFGPNNHLGYVAAAGFIYINYVGNGKYALDPAWAKTRGLG